MNNKVIAYLTINIVKNKGLAALDEFANMFVRKYGCDGYWEYFENLTLGNFLPMDYGDEWLNHATKTIIGAKNLNDIVNDIGLSDEEMDLKKKYCRFQIES